MASDELSLVLGDEYDEALRQRLIKSLRGLGAVVDQVAERRIGGSQELETWRVSIAGESLLIEAETFIGLTVIGPTALVQRLAAMVRSDAA